MPWQYILTALSCTLFFGFVILCVCKFGLKDCYSAYGPLWHEVNPKFNIWTLITLITPVMIMPVLLQASEGSIWQFTAFLCLVPMSFVALTPDYQQGGLPGRLHLISAICSAVFSILFTALVTPKYFWILATYAGIALICTFIFGKKNWMFWFEMASYASLYTIIFVMISILAKQIATV
jgi:hypothetical protein